MKVYRGILWVFPDVMEINIYKASWNVSMYLKRSKMTIYGIFKNRNTTGRSPEQSYGFSLTNRQYGLKSKFHHYMVYNIA